MNAVLTIQKRNRVIIINIDRWGMVKFTNIVFVSKDKWVTERNFRILHSRNDSLHLPIFVISMFETVQSIYL